MPVDVASIRRALPEGRTLPEELWTRRHRGILILLWAHAVFIPAFAMVRGYSLLHIAFEAAVVPVLALVATAPSFGRRLRSAAASFGLLSCSAVLVHLSGGVIEMHFHFFVMVAVVALYQDWICFLAAIAYVLVHHGILGAIDPGSVFNHYAALNHPWKWAAIHAFFVAGISVACLVTWREDEDLIAAHAAVAVDNARLYEAEHQSREFAERAQRRLAVLADASRVLASSLDVDQILGDLADIAAPGMGDCCVVYLAGDDGALRPVVTGPADQAAGSRPPLPAPIGAADAGDPIARSFRTGHSLLLDEPCDELRLVAGAGAADGPPATSGLVVALVGREGPLGVLALTTTAASGRQLGGDDVSLAEELGRRAAVAVEHARLYASQRSAAETLQHSLLPEVLPELPGVEIASRYQAGGPGVDIGGDWYDVLALTDGRLALAMGDVVGRGIPAASLMGQLRNGLRAYVVEGRPPAQVLVLLNRLLRDCGAPHQMATLVVMVLDPETGELRYANAGHPPPLVQADDGSTRFLEEAVGVPLGAIGHADYPEATFVLTPGSTLLLYTDGLVEDRTMPLDVGFERLRASLGDAPDDLDAMCEHVTAHVRAAECAQDDMALLAVRWLELGATLDLQLPTQARVLRPLRATMRRWLATAGVSDHDAYEILVATTEACSNAIRHGSPQATHFDLRAELNGDLAIVVRSAGRWRERRPSTPGGRGLDIMRQFMDDTEVDGGVDSTEIRMRRRLVPSPSAQPVGTGGRRRCDLS